MANSPHETITKSWVHEPERRSGKRSEKLARFSLSRIGEVPTLFAGLALLLLGRRLGGTTGRAVGAVGATVSLTAGGRVFNRLVVARFRSTPEPIPG